MILKLIIFILLIVIITLTRAQTPCCIGNNEIVNRSCLDGGNFTLTCSQKYLISSEENVILNKGILQIENVEFHSTQFCYSKLKEEEVFLVCIEGENKFESIARDFIYPVCNLLSTLFIVLTIVIYVKLKMSKLQDMCIINMLISLALAYVSLAFLQNDNLNMTCIITAVLVYISFLCAFAWLNILSFHFWRKAVEPNFLKGIANWKVKYYEYVIILVSIHLISLLVVNFSAAPEAIHPQIGLNSCWFKDVKTTFLYFYGTIAILLLINTFFYFHSVSVYWKQISYCDLKAREKVKRRLLLCIKLFIVMGISWIFEIVSAIPQLTKFYTVWMLTDFFNSMSGIFLFLVLVVLRPDVREKIVKKGKILGVRVSSGNSHTEEENGEEMTAINI